MLVQTYAPQPNFLNRHLSLSELVGRVDSSHLDILADKLNDWDFHATQFSDEDLVWCSVLIFEHILKTGGSRLARYKMSRG